MGRRRVIAVSLVSGTLFLTSSLSSSAETLITTVDGKEYVGDVVAAGVNTLKIQLDGTGYQIVPLQSISRIQVDINDSEPIEGTFLDWSDGEIVVRVGDRDVAIRDGTITSVLDVGVAAGGAQISPSEPAAEEQLLPVEQPKTPEPADGDRVPQKATM